MSEKTHTRAADDALFSVDGRVPSSALIEKVLRGMSDGPEAVLNEETVEALCRRLRESARLVSEFGPAGSAPDRAESFRYLLSMVAYAVDAGLLNADALEPMFSQPYRLHLLDWGAASPDAVYRRAMVREDHLYRVHGRLGNARYLSIDFRQSTPACTLLREDLPIGRDGDFEIFLGGPPRETGWWPLRGATGLLVREFFDDWLAARRSRLRIECLDGGPAPRVEHQSRRVAAEFDVIGQWIREGAVRYWAERSKALSARARNQFLPGRFRGDTKLPATHFGWWDLAPDEALLVELPDPRAEFWGFHLATSLWHTLDYANRLTTHNGAQAHRDPDGIYRFAVSAEDPGIHNWLDTTGLRCGVLILRVFRAASAAPPRSRVVEVSEVADTLRETRRCTPEQRRVQIAERREGVARLVCD